MRINSGLLPVLRRKHSHLSRRQQFVFGGLSATPSPEGCSRTGKDIVRMEGVSARAYPALSTMEKRFSYDVSATSGLPHGLYTHHELIMARGHYLYRVASSGLCTRLCHVTDNHKTFASFGSRLLILPDRICLNTADGSVRSLDAQTGTLTDVTLGTQFLTHGLSDWEALGFVAGDGVQIKIENYILGSTSVFDRKITAVSGGTLFFDKSFEMTGTYDLEVTRSFPPITCACALGDRLLGCGGNTVYLSEAGNPFNWSVCADEASDPVILQTSGAGDVVACALWQETAIIFKEDRAYQLMGHGAEDFLLLQLAIPGVAAHSPGSLCRVDGKLYYLGTAGVYCFNGGYPASVGFPLPKHLTEGVGGSDGYGYYLVAKDAEGISRTYAYHCEGERWYVQDLLTAVAMATHGGRLYIQTATGALLSYPAPGEPLPENQTLITETASALPSYVVFGKESGGTPDGVRLLAIHLDVEGDDDSGSMTVSVSYDEGTWSTVGIIPGGTVGRVHLPVYPRRAETYSLRLTMTGAWRVTGITCDDECGKQ